MLKVNIYECKTNLSKYLAMLDEGTEQEIIICNRGVPCFRIAPIAKEKNEIRFGTALKYLNGNDGEKAFTEEIDQEIEAVSMEGMNETW